MDAETAHRLAVRTLRATGGLPYARGPIVNKEYEVFGMRFLSRVGLAAGFDKDAEILDLLPKLGFGFAEIGTVTPDPQGGNERPRLFREIETQSLFNRMGFNSLGASIVSQRMARLRPQLPENFRVGVNIGKMRNTSLEDAHEDYARAILPFKDLADFVVINISSPNTPDLRRLQSAEHLKILVNAVSEKLSVWKKPPPLLVKLAPELTAVELETLAQAGDRLPLAGWVLTNTMAGQGPAEHSHLNGGWSGGRLTEISRDRLKIFRALTKLPIISVGGIGSVEEAQTRLSLGADLLQIYSSWVFRGPSFPRELSGL